MDQPNVIFRQNGEDLEEVKETDNTGRQLVSEMIREAGGAPAIVKSYSDDEHVVRKGGTTLYSFNDDELKD